MSKFEVHQERCPNCDHAQHVEIYVSINAGRMPEATDKLIDGSWEQLQCTGCGQAFTIDHRLLYSDLRRKEWIVQYPGSKRSNFRTLEDDVERTFNREYLERPPEPVRRQAADVHPQVCFGRPQLAEKLLAWRNNLDDCAVECLKLLLLRRYANLLLPLGPSEMRMSAVDHRRLSFIIMSHDGDRRLEAFSIRRSAYDQVAKNLDPFRLSFPALFDRPYVNACRYLH